MRRSISAQTAIGPFYGALAPDYDDPALHAAISDLEGQLKTKGASPSMGASHIYTLALPFHSSSLTVFVKAFRRASFWKSIGARYRGSAARRSWETAGLFQQNGIGTPAPIAYLDQWRLGRLEKSFYLSENLPYAYSFRDELIRLYKMDPHCEKILALLQCVAEAIRKMHDAGLIHYDLGNQNILLHRQGDGRWHDVRFVDLNRARVRKNPSWRHRARDISRIHLPSEFLRIFIEMYFGHKVPPREFTRWERCYRRRFAFHSRSRRFRHPFRALKQRTKQAEFTVYPPEKDIWIWDERSAQAISAMSGKDRRRHQSLANALKISGAVAGSFLPIHSRFRQFRSECFNKPVEMDGRIGIAIQPRPGSADREIRLLEALGHIPVLIRFYNHETEKEWKFAAETARRLHAGGHSVSAALVQDRRSVLEPDRWNTFTRYVLTQLQDIVDRVEIGHAVNRVKWGVWTVDEYLQLLEIVAGHRKEYPRVKFMGPAIIDFEYHYTVAILKALPKSFTFSALSHHLYVDRRGAPENRQGAFDALDKFALARAIAEWSPACEKRVIISETNWPLKNTGAYSPVESPYEASGPRMTDPSVSEEDYADFMIRYLLIALCSGMVERVYWWRLIARGFGLVDDTEPDRWRERPAFHQLRFFLSLCGQGTFLDKISTPEGAHYFRFRQPDGQEFVLAYSHPGEVHVRPPFAFDQVLDAQGNPLTATGPEIRLSGHPLYLIKVRKV